jgi:hypothetical protein
VFCGRHLLAAKLRRSNIDASAGAVEEVARIVKRIRERWPRVRILLRADAGLVLCTPLYEALFVKLLVATLLLALIRAVPRLGRSYGNRRSPAEPCIRWARASPQP